jgi:hypothetical protein
MLLTFRINPNELAVWHFQSAEPSGTTQLDRCRAPGAHATPPLGRDKPTHGLLANVDVRLAWVAESEPRVGSRLPVRAVSTKSPVPLQAPINIASCCWRASQRS